MVDLKPFGTLVNYDVFMRLNVVPSYSETAVNKAFQSIQGIKLRSYEMAAQGTNGIVFRSDRLSLGNIIRLSNELEDRTGDNFMDSDLTMEAEVRGESKAFQFETKARQRFVSTAIVVEIPAKDNVKRSDIKGVFRDPTMAGSQGELVDDITRSNDVYIITLTDQFRGNMHQMGMGDISDLDRFDELGIAYVNVVYTAELRNAKD